MKVPITLTVVLLSAACAPASTTSQARSPDMTATHPASTDRSAQHAATLRKLYDQAINGHRLELLTELVSPDYVGPRGKKGPEGFAQTIRALTTGIPDLRFEIDEIIAGPAGGAVRWRWSGNHTGTLFGMAPSNKTVSNTGIGLYYFDDAGKIARAQVETDRLGLLQQLGLVDASLGAPRQAR
jgi:predicted ester cyclase